ncbi:MAG TPA: hypothetical protein VHO70_10450 [Chitinispirillaceae bacterium]|nr:hypothetical protein [Chitinispirillaceae bacterium]
MALILRLTPLLVIFTITLLFAQTPFPEGYFMSTQGTIFQDNWISSREPYGPALLANDSTRMGISAGAISYYDRMDNLSDRLLYRACGGGWVEFDKLRLNLWISQLEAFSIYFEQNTGLSIGTYIYKSASVSIDFQGYRNGLHHSTEPARTRADIGVSTLYKFRAVSVTGSISNLTLKKAGRHMNQEDLTATIGLHTKYSRIGAQGVVLKILPRADRPVQVIVGEEFRITERIGMNASFSSNPLFIGIGFFAGIKKSDLSVSLVNHPDLGWSRGFSIACSR